MRNIRICLLKFKTIRECSISVTTNSLLATWPRLSISLSKKGEAICYLGYRPEIPPDNIAYYGMSVAIQDSVSPSDRRFVKLKRGTLILDSILTSDEPVEFVEDHFLVLPKGSDAYFGVVDGSTNRENISLTQQVFGATIEEIRTVASCFGVLTGRRNINPSDAGRVTFSRTRKNYCDISGCLIPPAFPYLAFEKSQHTWGHVSLHGFYRVLAFLCAGGDTSPIYMKLIDDGVEPTLLIRVIEAGSHFDEPIREAF